MKKQQNPDKLAPGDGAGAPNHFVGKHVVTGVFTERTDLLNSLNQGIKIAKFSNKWNLCSLTHKQDILTLKKGMIFSKETNQKMWGFKGGGRTCFKLNKSECSPLHKCLLHVINLLPIFAALSKMQFHRKDLCLLSCNR